MSAPSDNPWQAPQQVAGSPFDAPGPQQHGQPYTPPPGAWQPVEGPLGKVRPTGVSILLFVGTIGVYGVVYNYKVHTEMQRHSGRGIGGAIAVVLTLAAGIAMPFVTSSEVGGLYARKGRPQPVRVTTGLLLVLPAVLGYVLMLALLFSLAATASQPSEPDSVITAGVVTVMALYGVGVVAGALVWFVRTNGALNRYWESVAHDQPGRPTA